MQGYIMNTKNFFMENNVVIYQSNDGLVKMEAIVDAQMKSYELCRRRWPSCLGLM